MYNRIQTIIYDVEEFDKIKPLSKDRVVSPLPSWHFQCWNESWFRWLELTDDAHPPTLQTYFLYIYIGEFVPTISEANLVSYIP
jgi:hypothetical protein